MTTVDPATGLQDFHGHRVAFALGLTGQQVKSCVGIVKKLYQMFIEKDMDMLEINPWVQPAYRWYHEMSESTCVNVYDVEDWVIEFYTAYNKIYPNTY